MDQDEARRYLESLPDRTKLLLGGAVAAVVGVVVLVLAATDAFPGVGGPTTPTTGTPSTETAATGSTSTTEPEAEEHRLDLDNVAGISLTSGDLTQAQLDAVAFTSADPFTEPISPTTNGRSPQGQFRIQCQPSHFSTEDPIVFPGEPGSGHLHMFFGNLLADADSTGNSLLEAGASTCQGGELNRSAYWMPAMVDADGAVIHPEAITLYYKSHRVDDLDGTYPHGLQMAAGFNKQGTHNQSFRASERLSWGCYNGSSTTAIRASIPGTVSAPCPAGQPIQATIQFPQCIAVEDGEPVLTSTNFVDHTLMLFSESGNYGDQGKSCPASHPYRVPQISYLVRWPTVEYVNGRPDRSRPIDVSGWRLSSDHHDSDPGGSLHADWLGAWNLQTNESWLEGCFDTASPMNCSLGQTGQPRGLARIRGESLSNMIYVGPTRLEVD